MPRETPQATDAATEPKGAATALRFWILVFALLLGTELYFHLRLPDWPYSRGWNVAHKDSGPFVESTVPGPFFPHVRHAGISFGDLSFLANVPGLRHERVQTFSTDGYGYRNTPGSETGPWHAVLFGDSMMAGSGVSDDETLPARLQAKLDAPVYNAGGKDASIVLAEERWTSSPPRFVLLESVERFLQADDAIDRLIELEPGSLSIGAPESRAPSSAVRGRWSRAFSASTHAAKLAYSVGRYRLFGELATPAVVLGTDGRTLFSSEELVHGALPPVLVGVERIADAVDHAHEVLAAHGIELVFLAAPAKANILRERVPDEFAASMRPAGELLDELHRLLEERGVPFIDLQPSFREAASRDPGAELYWSDDTHWSPLGADLAAEVVAEELIRLQAR